MCTSELTDDLVAFALRHSEPTLYSHFSFFTNLFPPYLFDFHHFPAVHHFHHLMQILNPKLIKTLSQHQIFLIDICFRWFICLLCRELPLDALLTLWDMYLTLLPSIPNLHTYVCVAFLDTWAPTLLTPHTACNLEAIFSFILKLPTEKWAASDARSLIARALHIWFHEQRLVCCALFVVIYVVVCLAFYRALKISIVWRDGRYDVD
jgi:hypothetical protein